MEKPKEAVRDFLRSATLTSHVEFIWPLITSANVVKSSSSASQVQKGSREYSRILQRQILIRVESVELTISSLQVSSSLSSFKQIHDVTSNKYVEGNETSLILLLKYLQSQSRP